MIYIQPQAGLGNRMMAVESAYNLAKKYNTKLIVYWTRERFMNQSFYELFQSTSDIEVHDISVSDDPPVLCENVFNIGGRGSNLADVSGVIRALDEDKDVYIRTYARLYECEQYSMFVPTETIKDKAISLLGDESENLIGVHIRATYHVNIMRESPVWLYIEEIKREISINEKVRFYVASDSLAVIEFLKLFLGNKMTYNIYNKKEDQVTWDVRAKNVENALIDMYCLSMCNKIIASRSTLAYTASIWNGKKELRRVNLTSAIKLPCVTVVVYLCKDKKYNIECIDSILSQDFKDIEILIINDKDDNEMLYEMNSIDGYIDNPNVRFIDNILDKSSAFNASMMFAKGQYIMFLNGYDRLDKNVISILYENINKGADIACSSGYYIDLGDDKILYHSYKNDINNTSEILDTSSSEFLKGEWENYKISSCIGCNLYSLMPIRSSQTVFDNSEEDVEINFHKKVMFIQYEPWGNRTSLKYVRIPIVGYIHRSPYLLRTETTSLMPKIRPDYIDKKENEVGKFFNIVDIEKYDRNINKVSGVLSIPTEIPWRDYFHDAIQDIDWIRKKNVYVNETKSVGYEFFYPLCRLLDEYAPKNILEFNFDQATKITAQYAASHDSFLTVLANDRDRVEHLMGCWGIPWKNVIIRGAELRTAKKDGYTGVVYSNFQEVTKGKKYDFIILKSPLKKDVSIHVDILSNLPEILYNNFAILMDHVEDACGQKVFQEMMDVLEKNGIGFMRKDFSVKNRLVSMLFSESLKYIDEF